MCCAAEFTCVHVCAVLPQVVRGYEAVLTDFGSARSIPIHIDSRAAALTVKEDAEVGRHGYSSSAVCTVIVACIHIGTLAARQQR